MPSNEDQPLLDLFRRSGALLEGHFRLSSGLHSSGYLQAALVLQHPIHAETIGRSLADRVRDLRPTVVLSPALGGIVIGHEVVERSECVPCSQNARTASSCCVAGS